MQEARDLTPTLRRFLWLLGGEETAGRKQGAGISCFQAVAESRGDRTWSAQGRWQGDGGKGRECKSSTMSAHCSFHCAKGMMGSAATTLLVRASRITHSKAKC